MQFDRLLTDRRNLKTRYKWVDGLAGT